MFMQNLYILLVLLLGVGYLYLQNKKAKKNRSGCSGCIGCSEAKSCPLANEILAKIPE